MAKGLRSKVKRAHRSMIRKNVLIPQIKEQAEANHKKILDDISFTATDRAGEKIIINKEYINKNLDTLVKDTDLSKFIL